MKHSCLPISTLSSVVVSLFIFTASAGMLYAQSTVQATQAPLASTAPLSSSTPLASVAPKTQGALTGTWTVERAIYDLYMVLKDVTGDDDAFYASISFGAGGKGTVSYNGKGGTIDIEYDMREQVLTIAYGSRLKPMVDLYRMIVLADGNLFLKSQRLGTRNGTIHYVLKRVN